MKVLYVAAEGAAGLYRRIDAWRELNGSDTGDLLVYPEPIQLGDAGQVRELMQIAEEDERDFFIYDTRARVTLGLEENAATDQGIAIDAAERIRVAGGGTGLVVHHSGLEGGHGRGTSAWDGGVWSDLRVTRNKREMAAQIELFKHKDAPDGYAHRYLLEKVGATLVAVPTHEIVTAEMLDKDEKKITDCVADIWKLKPPISADVGAVKCKELLKDAGLASPHKTVVLAALKRIRDEQ